MTMKTVIGYLVLILESIIMCSIGYSIFTWDATEKVVVKSYI